MANNYTQFSVELPNPQTENPMEAIKDFWEGWQILRDRDIEANPDREFEAYNFTVELQETGSLWVHSDESGDPFQAADFIQEYLRYLGVIKGGVFFSWAETCSKPRINEFGGGCFIVTAFEQHWQGSRDLIQAHPEIPLINRF